MPEDNTGSGNTLKAVFAVLIGFIFLASVSVLIKLEITSGATIEWVVFIQYLTCLTIITVIASKNKFRDLHTKHLKNHVIRGISGILAFSLLVIAISKIPVVNATLLNNTAPIFIPLITFLWLRNKIDKRIWWGIFVGFTGIVLILDPGASDFFKSGDLYGLASGILLATTYVALGILSKTESFVTILFYYSIIAVLLSLPFAVSNWSDPPLLIWIYGILTGVLFISYLYLLQYAFRFVPAVKLSPLNFSVVVFTGILEWLVFGHIPGMKAILGIILVISGGILAITLHEKDNKELKHHWHH